MRRIWRMFLVLGCLPAWGAAQSPQAKPPPNAAEVTRPNILLLILDDVGRDKIGCYELGDEATRPLTPNIDRLAANGIRFDNYYTNPICSPTRAQILTGRHAFRTDVRVAVRPYQDDSVPLSYDEVALPELLGDVGYATAQIGKWHLGSLVLDGPMHALNTGWNVAVGTQGNPGSNGQTYERWLHTDNGVESWREGYLTSATVDDAIQEIKSMPEPWHTWVGFHAGHAPLHVPPRHLHDRDSLEIGDDPVLMYQAMIEALDREIGRLLDSIPADVRARTTVIVVSDNGSLNEVIVPPLPNDAGKGRLLEGGAHVPMIVSGFSVPKVNRGRVATKLAASVDLFATMVDLAGATLPTDRVIDGVSLRPVLLNPEAQVRRLAFAERYETRQAIGEIMVTNGRYKLIRLNNVGIGAPEFRFFRLFDAEPGTDGPDLCDCPENLRGEERRTFFRLGDRIVDLLALP